MSGAIVDARVSVLRFSLMWARWTAFLFELAMYSVVFSSLRYPLQWAAESSACVLHQSGGISLHAAMPCGGVLANCVLPQAFAAYTDWMYWGQ